MRRPLAVSVISVILLGCSSVLGFDDVEFEEATGGAGGGGGSTQAGGSSGSAGSPAAGGSGGGSIGGSSGQATGGTAGTATGGAAGSAAGGSGGADPYAQARQQCVDTINQLRASLGLPPYERWIEGESCADLEATYDQETGTPHNAFKTNKFGCPHGSAQNECLGGGANGIVSCLNAMWAEKDQAGCSGCDLCTGPGGCENCDFSGSVTGDVCGHYVNMSAKWFSRAACGFSSTGGWAVINFQ